MKLKISKIYEIASSRPDGYVEDVIQSGEISEDGQWLDISKQEYERLVDKYRPKVETVSINKDERNNLNIKTKQDLIEDRPLNSVLRKAESLTNSVLDWTKSGFPIPDSETFNARLETCKGCEFWDESGFANTGRCKKCGCSTQAKLRMATEKCPIGKW
jgi:hypothetical protein